MESEGFIRGFCTDLDIPKYFSSSSSAQSRLGMGKVRSSHGVVIMAIT